MATSTTRRGGEMATTGVERIAQRARQEPHTRYTSLMHHFTVDNLRACFESLDGKKATGVDGVTKAMYGQHPEETSRRCTRNCIRGRTGLSRYAGWRSPRTMAVPVPWG